MVSYHNFESFTDVFFFFFFFFVVVVLFCLIMFVYALTYVKHPGFFILFCILVVVFFCFFLYPLVLSDMCIVVASGMRKCIIS